MNERQFLYDGPPFVNIKGNYCREQVNCPGL